ncbi:hypothetical protein GW17_00049287 [Ensete ventricosum]|nr:hypothetical protein GW17_00049287 [Ensete ventricosum]
MGGQGFATDGEKPRVGQHPLETVRGWYRRDDLFRLRKRVRFPMVLRIWVNWPAFLRHDPPSSAKMLVKVICAFPVSAVYASVSAEWARLVLARVDFTVSDRSYCVKSITLEA